jgi:outer membrane protein OmpA-like peptidoglycan-associated protein
VLVLQQWNCKQSHPLVVLLVPPPPLASLTLSHASIEAHWGVSVEKGGERNAMIRRIVFIVTAMLFTSTGIFAQTESARESGPDVAYWVAFWSRPPVFLFGPQQEEFFKNMQGILFPYDNHDEPVNPSALDSDIQWLKDHPNVRFYIGGYASSRGPLIYNLALSQRRADWVKQVLISRGIAENRIKVAAGWGEMYPVCPELNDECWAKNKVVRFHYSPD